MAYSPNEQSNRETKTGVLVLAILGSLFVAVAGYRYFQTTQAKATAASVATDHGRAGNDKQATGKQQVAAETPSPIKRRKEPEQPRRLPPMEDHAGLLPQHTSAPIKYEPHAALTTPTGNHQTQPPAVQRTSHTQPVHSYPPIAKPTAPAPRATTREIVTKQDDSFWSIAEQAYGAGSYFKALYAYNRSNFPQPDRLQAGAIVIAPPLEKLQQLFPADCPAAGRLKSAATPSPELAKVQLASHEESTIQRLYNVQPGEDLYGIAERELGAGHRWTEIYRLNADILGGAIERVPVGLRLRMPPR